MDVRDQSTGELKIKIKILQLAISKGRDEGRDVSAVTEDLDTLVNEIKRRGEKPPPTVINLKVAKIKARAPRPDEENSDG
jgi:hypothetical protein